MTGSPSLSDFPVRPLRVPGESFGSWCWRIFLANGHAAVPPARAACKSARSEPEMIAEDSLVSIFGIERLQELRQLEGDLLTKWRNHKKPNWYKWAATARICPQCVTVSGCHFVQWDLPLVTACSAHGCRLIDACSGCRRMLTWTSLREGWICTCGNQLLREPPALASAPETFLSTVLCLASDCTVPLPSNHDPAIALALDGPYCVRDVYEVLWWFRKMQRALADWRVYPIPRSWPDISRNDVRLRPGAQEIRLLMGRKCAIRTQACYALKRFYRGYDEMFVDLHDLVDDKNLRGLLGELDGQSNPLSRMVLDAISSTLDEHCANFPARPSILFHPRLSTRQRELTVLILEEWWQRFSTRTPQLPSAMRLCTGVSGSETATRRNPTLALELLNTLAMISFVDAANTGVDVMAHRWHVPAEVQGENVKVAQLTDYLFGLPEGELVFLLEMATVAVQLGQAEAASDP